MSFFNLKGYILIYALISSESYVKSETINSNMIKTIMHDMEKAFCSITNNTNILTKMYDFHTIETDISTMVFKLPSIENEPESENILIMNRREFTTPIFPNLTEGYMALRRFKIYKTPVENADLNTTALIKREMQSLAQDYVRDVWSDMGLDGWKGQIADPLNPGGKNDK